MIRILTIIVLCSFVTSGNAWAAAPPAPPAPKALAGNKTPPSKPDSAVEDKKLADDSDDIDEPAPKKHTKKHKTKVDDEDVYDKEAAAAGSAPQGELTIQGDKRIKMLLYDETDVYTITTRYGYQTNVIFSPQEEIELISVGDRSLWQIIPSGNRLFIRPMEEDVITNMTVLTNKHSYQFDLKSLPTDKSGNIYVAQFVYQDAKKAAPVLNMLPPLGPVAPSLPPSAPLTSAPFGVGPSIPSQVSMVVAPPPVNPAPQSLPAPAAAPNYRYTYSGSDALAPLQVYDDGRVTYLKYLNAAALAPSAFIVDSSGKEIPAAYAIKGDYMVIDAVAGELVIKSNANTVHVFNEILNPGS